MARVYMKKDGEWQTSNLYEVIGILKSINKPTTITGINGDIIKYTPEELFSLIQMTEDGGEVLAIVANEVNYCIRIKDIKSITFDLQ